METEQPCLLRMHQSIEEQFMLAKGGWEKILLPRKEKERKFQEVSWQSGSLPTDIHCKGYLLAQEMYHQC